MNARDEFIKHVGDNKIKCAYLHKDFDWESDDYEYKCLLKIGYSPEEYEDFLGSLDFSYDNGYGGQELFGTIWYKDGSWSERGEYDGSEWWEYKTVPGIPVALY